MDLGQGDRVGKGWVEVVIGIGGRERGSARASLSRWWIVVMV
ncbi:hypothetical protein DB30_02699 [Enhygromyxa salina]|uniref:Uncharacterized protein n=1 Tax=Enhygromyxa salina TaxID=215803 RepID=A0A0C2A7D7_9BACT|nr:hypothetical protein [Enhygromyxa salina]KIG19418.1 hypothetical protein DB30_02699 [Enhygromyxa salina]